MTTPTRSADTGSATMRELRQLRRALLRASVIFGSLAVAVVVTLGHGSDRPARYADSEMGVDEMTTGSIGVGDRYLVSRSVLQPAGGSPCLYFPDGSRRGSC